MEIKTKFSPGDYVYVVVSKGFFTSESAVYVCPLLVAELLIIRCCLTSVTTDGAHTHYTVNSFRYGQVTKCAEILGNCIFKTFDEAKSFAIERMEYWSELRLQQLEAKTKADNSIEEDKL